MKPSNENSQDLALLVHGKKDVKKLQIFCTTGTEFVVLQKLQNYSVKIIKTIL